MVVKKDLNKLIFYISHTNYLLIYAVYLLPFLKRRHLFNILLKS